MWRRVVLVWTDVSEERIASIFYLRENLTSYKVITVLHSASCHKNVWGSGNLALRILNLSTGWRWVVSFMIHLLYCWRKNPMYSLHRRLCGIQRQYCCDDKKENHCPCWELNPLAIKPVTSHYTDWDIPAHKGTCSTNQDATPFDKQVPQSFRELVPSIFRI
jgi:hypothetical protein